MTTAALTAPVTDAGAAPPPRSEAPDAPDPRTRALLEGPIASTLLGLAAPGVAQAATYPVGFSERTVFSGLTNPSAIRFAPDGRVFVAEKSGLIKVFDSLSDPQPDVFADREGDGPPGSVDLVGQLHASG